MNKRERIKFLQEKIIIYRKNITLIHPDDPYKYVRIAAMKRAIKAYEKEIESIKDTFITIQKTLVMQKWKKI